MQAQAVPTASRFERLSFCGRPKPGNDTGRMCFAMQFAMLRPMTGNTVATMRRKEANETPEWTLQPNSSQFQQRHARATCARLHSKRQALFFVGNLTPPVFISGIRGRATLVPPKHWRLVPRTSHVSRRILQSHITPADALRSGGCGHSKVPHLREKFKSLQKCFKQHSTDELHAHVSVE